MKWMKETRNETALPSARELLPTLEDTALLEAVRGGTESAPPYIKPNGIDIKGGRFAGPTNGGVTHED